MIPLQTPSFDAHLPDDALFGMILVLLTLFGGLYAFVRTSRYVRQSQSQMVGPHVIVPQSKGYVGLSQTIYRCKYCGKERERAEFFRSEDCEEFPVAR